MTTTKAKTKVKVRVPACPDCAFLFHKGFRGETLATMHERFHVPAEEAKAAPPKPVVCLCHALTVSAGIGPEVAKANCPKCRPAPQQGEYDAARQERLAYTEALVRSIMRAPSSPAEAISPSSGEKTPAAEKAAVNAKAEPKKAKGPGVIQTIIQVLRTGSKKAPLSRDAILDRLVPVFPERERASMRGTVSSQVPSALLAEKGIVVSTDGKGGYWLPKE